MNNNVTKKIALKEIIIVEGRDDVTAVKRVISSEVIPLHGFTGMTKAKIDFLIQLSKTNDLILLTDPDFVGKKLREVISKRIPTIKHAYISRVEGTKDHKDGTKNIGIENASNESILNALSNTINSQTYSKDNNYIFTIQDLIDNGLSVGTNAKEKRQKLVSHLHIGYHNSKQLLRILNRLSLPKDKFLEILTQIKQH